jgi:hypothetical protein
VKHKPIPTLTEADLKRFWDKVDVRGPDDCWEWIGSTGPNGYGRIGKRIGHLYLAHRWAYFIEYGVDPGRMKVCHTCDNPSCCNPAHLWLGTTLDNNQDAMKKNRHTPGERNYQAKLTEQDVRAILKSNEFHRVLAERYGVCRQAITHIKNGRRWAHIKRSFAETVIGIKTAEGPRRK